MEYIRVVGRDSNGNLLLSVPPEDEVELLDLLDYPDRLTVAPVG